jgi:hypothetical protein
MEQARGNYGSLEELFSAGMRMTHRAKLARNTCFRDKAKTILHREFRRDERPGNTLEGPGMQNGNKELRHKTAAAS